MADSLFKPSDRMRELQILEAIEENPALSQRALSHKFNIALGLTNAFLKRMARKGWIKLKTVPPRRIGYYLTPKGFAEKAKLSMDFMSYTIRHYTQLKKIIGQKLLNLQDQGVRRIAFCGVSDEMEIAFVTLQGVDMELVGIFDEDDRVVSETVWGYPVRRIEEIPAFHPEAVMITKIENSNVLWDILQRQSDGLPILSIID